MAENGVGAHERKQKKPPQSLRYQSPSALAGVNIEWTVAGINVRPA